MEVTKYTRIEYGINGKEVKMARVNKGWTISKLAELSGVTRKTIGEIERGTKRKIRYSTILQIANTLGKEVEDLCNYSREEEDISGI